VNRLHPRRTLPSLDRLGPTRPLGRGVRARGPVLDGGMRRRRRRGGSAGRLLLGGVFLSALWAWVQVIGQDLTRGPDGDQPTAARAVSIAQARAQRAGGSAAGAGGKPTAAARPQTAADKPATTTATVVGGPANARAPQGGPAAPAVSAAPAAPAGPAHPYVGQDVGRALLVTARDHVARGVGAARRSVLDRGALRGTGADMVERGLALIGFDLRAAVMRDRFARPDRYGLPRQPAQSDAEARRALTTGPLRSFLAVWGRELPLVYTPGVDDTFRAGDIAMYRRGRRELVAIVSDRTDVNGVSLLLTLDPADRVAREKHSLADFPLIGHYRLDADVLARVTARLGIEPVAADDALGSAL
jgi:uncharacterized protein YijF (DUF1287 family)